MTATVTAVGACICESEWDDEACPAHGENRRNGAGAAEERRHRLTPMSAADLVRYVATTPTPSWLIEGWFARGGEDYGILSAEAKAGKTWLGLDLAVAVAAGVPWLDVYNTSQGTVLVYVGEGGRRTTERRLQAICEHYGVRLADLPLHIVEGVPHLAVVEDELMFEQSVSQLKPALVIIDPLYLAARGANASQLNEMGEVLETAQRVCQRHEAALLIIHHWNRGGTGGGGDRATGAGPWEWARVSLSMRADGQPKRTVRSGGRLRVEQRLIVEGQGGNMAPITLQVDRAVTGVPRSLVDPLGYEVEATEIASTQDQPKENAQSVRSGILATVADHPLRCTAGDLFKPDGPFRVAGRKAVEAALKPMLRDGELVAVEHRHPDTERKADRLQLGPNLAAPPVPVGEQLAGTESEF